MTCDPVAAGAEVIAVTLTMPGIIVSDSEGLAFDEEIVAEEVDTGATSVRE